MKQGKKIQLRPKTFALLVRLVENAGNLCDKQSLLADIWDDANVEEGNLNRTVSELRKHSEIRGKSRHILRQFRELVIDSLRKFQAVQVNPRSPHLSQYLSG